MIRYNPKNWFKPILGLHKSQMMRHLGPNLIFIGLYTAAICYLTLEVFDFDFKLRIDIHKLIGIVLGLVLVFRTNTAYERWWEGRKLLGALVNHSRMFAIKMNTILEKEDSEQRNYYAVALSNFTYSLENHLTEEDALQHIRTEIYEPDYFKGIKHFPNRIVDHMQHKLQGYLKDGIIDGMQFLTLTRETDALIDVLGGCERIKKTPIPYSYSTYIKKFVFVYLYTLPFGFVEQFEYWSIPAVIFMFYILVGVELIAEEIEDPFGRDENDLPMDTIGMNIDENVHEILNVDHQVHRKPYSRPK